jgi:hypothetical protein
LELRAALRGDRSGGRAHMTEPFKAQVTAT